MNTLRATATLALGIALFGAANALTLTSIPSPISGGSTLFKAVGTLNFGNQKARLEAAGTTTQQGGNPGNGWFNNQKRSWEVLWNNATGTVSFKVYSSTDWSGNAAMSMSRTPVFASGNFLAGLKIGGRTTATGQSLELDNIQFDGGSGWVDIDSAEGTTTGNLFNEKLYKFGGSMQNWTLRGTALFPTGSVTSDGMRFEVSGVQAVPEPGTMIALGLGAAALISKRRRK